MRVALPALAFVVLTSPLLAQHQEESVQEASPETAAVDESSDSCAPSDKTGGNGTDQESGRDCSPGSFEYLPSEQRQELSDEISENTQDALSLKRILLGSSHTFFGRIEPEYAAYFNGVLKDENDVDYVASGPAWLECSRTG